MAKYLYNGNIYPELKWDKTNYPYVYTWSSFAYAFTEPLSDAKNGFGYFTTAKAPFLCARLVLDENNKECWTDWVEQTEDKTISFGGPEWANHDILKSDGTVYLSASEPTPVTYPILLFEGEAITEDDGYGAPADTLSPVADFLAIGDKVRLTINGVSAEYEVKKVPTSNQSLIGNAGLNGNDVDAEDDGGEWLFATVSPGPVRMIYFYSRTVGTYQIKLELLDDGHEPEQPETDLTNIDLYRKINGKPTKLTLYKKVGGKLIPLDEYTKEVTHD